MREIDQLFEKLGSKKVKIEKLRFEDLEMCVEGSFELPRLAQLSASDQVFVAAFVCSHGSIREMEKAFGVSYPTIKNRLKKLSEKLALSDVQISAPEDTSTVSILERLDAGELSVEQALNEISS